MKTGRNPTRACAGRKTWLRPFTRSPWAEPDPDRSAAHGRPGPRLRLRTPPAPPGAKRHRSSRKILAALYCGACEPEVESERASSGTGDRRSAGIEFEWSLREGGAAGRDGRARCMASDAWRAERHRAHRRWLVLYYMYVLFGLGG